MAYRRKGGTGRTSTFDESRSATPEPKVEPAQPPPSSLAARAIRDSSAHGDSSLSSVYDQSAIASANRESGRQRAGPSGQILLQDWTLAPVLLRQGSAGKERGRAPFTFGVLVFEKKEENQKPEKAGTQNRAKVRQQQIQKKKKKNIR